MTAARLEFARALELVCRHLNPPHQPLPTSVTLADVGLEGLTVRADDMLFAYRYLRGLEMPGNRTTSSGEKPIWAKERGLLSPPTVAAEVKPGLLAVGDPFGAVRLFTRSRGRWECVAAMPTHADAVRDIIPLMQGGFLTASADGSVVVHRQDARGQWYGSRAAMPTSPPQPPSVRFTAMAQVSREVVIAAAFRGVLVELQALPSGEWEQNSFWMSGSSDFIALARHREQGFASLAADGSLQFWTRAGSGFSSMAAPGAYGSVKDIAEWRGGIIACTERGEIVTFRSSETIDQPVRYEVSRVASAPMLAIAALGDQHVATWSADRQLRIWAREDPQLTLRAALDVPDFAAPCLTVLCDGRIVYAESRGLAVAAPQANRTWRSEEIVSTYESAVDGIAPLGAGRVAFVDGGTAVRALRLNGAGPAEAQDVVIGTSIITALVALGEDTLAIGGLDGRLLVAREMDRTWRLEDLSPATSGAVAHLSASAGYLARASSNGDVAIWSQMPNGGFELKDSFSIPGLSALAIDGKGRIATSAPMQPLMVRELGIPAATRSISRSASVPCVALQWDEDGLLVLDNTGQLTRVTVGSQWQETVVRAGSPEQVLKSTFAKLHASPRHPIAYARGCAPLEIDGELYNFVHADIRALASSDDALYAGADALYVIEPRPNATPAIWRILVSDRLVMNARLDIAGGVKSVQLRPRDPSAAWTTVMAGGKAHPSDPLLHEYVAVLEPDGTLGEAHTSPGYQLSADRRTFTLEDPDLS